MTASRAFDRHLQFRRQYLSAGTVNEADDDQAGRAVPCVRKLRAVHPPALHAPAGRTEFVPGGGCALDARPLHQVGAQPQHVGGGIADSGGRMHAGFDFVDPVGAFEKAAGSDGIDDLVEGRQKPGVPVVGDRERRQVRDEVGHVAAGESGSQLGWVAFVGGRLEQDLDAGVLRLEGGDLVAVRGELLG